MLFPPVSIAEIDGNGLNTEINTEQMIFLKDPVATYNTQQIDRDEFLTFLKSSTGKEIDILPSEDVLRGFIKTYVIYQEWAAEAIKTGAMDDPIVNEKLGILKVLLIDGFYTGSELDEEIDLLLAELQEKEVLDENLMLSNEGLYFYGQQISTKMTRGKIDQDELLKQNLQQSYQMQKLKADTVADTVIDNPDYVAMYSWKKIELLADYFIDNYLDNLPKTAEELDKIYADWLKEVDFSEYKVRHIYSNDKEELEKALSQLKNQEITFEQAVQDYSTDQASKNKDGFINSGEWAQFMNMNHPFYQEIRRLKPGEMSSTVLEGAMGFHILLLEKKRPIDVPEYYNIEEIKNIQWREHKIKELMLVWLQDIDINIL